MRKIVLLLALSVGFFCANAQETEKSENCELLSKRGCTILPEQGDIAIGMDAAPVLQYFGNLLGGGLNPAPSFNSTDGQTIYGKYFLKENMAIRAKIKIGSGKTTTTDYIMEDSANPDPLVTVEDEMKFSWNNTMFSAGVEMRRGKGRVQGFYGGEAFFGVMHSKTEYTYANQFSADHPLAGTHNFGSNILAANKRVLERDNAQTIGYGARAFVGGEYFFAPNLSIGGEFGWGLTMTKTGDSELKTEEYTGTKLQKEEVKVGGNKAWAVDTDNVFNGSIFLLFHF